MDNNEIIAARSLIAKIDSGEAWVFGEHINTENEIEHKIFKDDSGKIIGIFFSCVFGENIRADISFEYDINDDVVNKSLWDLILRTKKKSSDSENAHMDTWIRNENRNIIKYLEVMSGNDPDLWEKYNNPAREWSPHTRYASVEYIMKRENFSKELAQSKSQVKNVVIKSFEKEKIDEYLLMMDMAMTFSPHNFRGDRDGMLKKLDEYSKADDKCFEAFWDSETEKLIGIYWNNECDVEDLAVSPEYQRMGYGSFILTRAIEQIFKIKDDQARLYCVDWNEKGQAFYRKYGMEVNGHSYNFTLN